MRTIESQLADTNRRKANLYEILELRGRDAPNLGDLSERLRSLNERAKGLAAQFATLDAEQTPTYVTDDATIEAIGGVLREVVSDRSDAKRAYLIAALGGIRGGSI